MNLKYFKAEKGNFGDELNPFIFNRLLKCISQPDNYSDIDFYGIGTLIDRRIDETRRTVLFGTGIRDICRTYNQMNWNIFFLRGPVSANILKAKCITDSAYAILLLDNFPDSVPCHKKKYPISIIPHYRHMNYINWTYITQHVDINIIDPQQPVETVIAQINQSKKIIASAMHGAIMADICRVPWVRLRMEVIPAESFFISDLKWTDWLSSLSLNDVAIPIRNYWITQEGKACIQAHNELIFTLKNIISYKDLFRLSSSDLLKRKVHDIKEEVDKFNDIYC